MSLNSFLTKAALSPVMGDMVETITYIPTVGASRPIKAQVFRGKPDNEAVITKRVTHYNLDTLSIFVSSDPVDGIPVITLNSDKVMVKRYITDSAPQSYRLVGVADQSTDGTKVLLG